MLPAHTHCVTLAEPRDVVAIATAGGVVLVRFDGVQLVISGRPDMRCVVSDFSTVSYEPGHKPARPGATHETP